MFHLRFLLQGMEIGFLQLLFRTSGGTVGLELGAVVGFLKQIGRRIHGICGIPSSFHTHIVILRISDFPADLPADSGGGGVGDFGLGGRLFLHILKMELYLDLAIAVVGHQFPLDNLFGGDFCLGFLCLVSRFFSFPNRFSHYRVKPLFIGKFQPGFTQKYHLPELPRYGCSSFFRILLLV